MFLDDDFITSLPNNPIVGAVEACRQVQELLERANSPDWTPAELDVLLEVCALLSSMRDSGILPLTVQTPVLNGDLDDDCKELNQFLYATVAELSLKERTLRFGSLQSHFMTSLGATFAYQFTDGDVERIQALIDELRKLVSASNQFEREHQQRLLKRLEKLQAEMHKKVSDLDRFWGLIGDAGVVLGKLGNDAKPIVDRVREIADIVWRTQSRAEELPTGTPSPLLEAPPAED